MLTKNVGKPDRVIRIIVGMALGVAAYLTGGTAGLIMGVAAAVALLTGIFSWCGLYSLLGINTCKIDEP
ncbi:MAG: DUF2892 domain-containing protein [Elusimicrobia bacterium]|nr:DUF2892 domain-containing protein [Elusimicrobiota bacterium]